MTQDGLPGCRPAMLEQSSQGGTVLHNAVAARQRLIPAQTECACGRDGHAEIGVVFKGWACRYRLLADGRRQIMDIHLPGDLIGLDGFFQVQCQDFILALSDVSYGGLDYDGFTRLLTMPHVSLHVIAQLNAEKRRLDNHLAMVGQLLAEEKIAALLLEFYDRLRQHQVISGKTFHFPLTQQQLGDFLGMTVVHVNRVLKRLREAGIVNVRHRIVVIHDMAKLNALASGRSSLVHSVAAAG